MKPLDNKDEALNAWLDGKEKPVAGSDIGLPPEHPFSDAHIVSTYSDDDAVEDGVLIDVTGDAHKCNIKIGRVLISNGIYCRCIAPRGKIEGKDSKGEDVLDVSSPLRHLFMKLAEAVTKAGRSEDQYWWFDFEGKQIKASHMSGRLTMCFPEED